jgi:hypothetical protein
MKVVHTDEALDNLDRIRTPVATNHSTIAAAFAREAAQQHVRSWRGEMEISLSLTISFHSSEA